MAKKPALKLISGRRSKLEDKIADQLEAAGVQYGYETLKVHFEIPARKAKYTPDFECGQIILEGKGYFRTAADRQRLILVKESNPNLDLRIVFQDARKPIYKGSPTSYAKWATDHGIPWADKGTVPKEWLKEMKQAQEKTK